MNTVGLLCAAFILIDYLNLEDLNTFQSIVCWICVLAGVTTNQGGKK